ncbi:sel1 repeat family protein [Lacihabitans sp. CCS-44]|uniref:tetratricopeptide repeat protein n=1 Tax=Lacihabitans sp. CCS-44 TaxID=2487331 RepID=UPI0020CE1D37|nr:hypothetical protein [Lacihabitans sp. CCS-44]MCP9753831.1 sel1 repeat family protein [Lacihabitans sp. CCS-44]
MKNSNSYFINSQNLLFLYENKASFEEKKLIYSKYLKGLRGLAYKNYAEAQFDLAGHYDDIGFWGFPNPFYNPRKKFYWFNKSASNGYSEAFNNLANMYENGEFVELSLENALSMYQNGANLGSENCKRNYKLLKKQIVSKSHSFFSDFHAQKE